MDRAPCLTSRRSPVATLVSSPPPSPHSEGFYLATSHRHNTDHCVTRPLPSSTNPQFQKEAKCTTFPQCGNKFYLHENQRRLDSNSQRIMGRIIKLNEKSFPYQMLSTYLVLIQKLILVPRVLSYPPRENPGNEVDRSSGERTGLNNVLRMSLTSLVYLSSPCAKHSGKVKFLHLRPFYLRPSKLIFVNANEGEILRIH